MREARRLRLRGRVRNLQDGRVEGEAFGDKAALGRFCQWLEQGPRSARVSLVQVQVQDMDWQDVPDDFSIS